MFARFCSLLSLLAAACAGPPAPEVVRPNVILIMTDDQGYGDYGFMGNPVLRTPNLDAMAARSARLTNFYVHPVCTPTRAALMTGRHPQRTRAIDTYLGRAMMDPAERTIAEFLRDAGYGTGIFGKWHLGDCFPMRAMDQGFDEALVHRGGGIGQPSDPIGAEKKYTDAALFHNGTRVPTEGYCTDVYFDRAIQWMREQRAAGKPFFAYLPTNAPHGPFGDVPKKLYEYYKSVDLSFDRFPQDRGHPLKGKQNDDRVARIFAMIENVDQNIGRMFEALREMGAFDNTLVLFLNDNGPNSRRYVAGHRGSKGSVYEGGIRSPLLAHWPARLRPGVASGRIAAHYDLAPTILSACGVARPIHLVPQAPGFRVEPAPDRFDGVDLMPLLDRSDVNWPDRAIFLQAHRGNVPVRYHHCMVRTQRWKLVNHSGFHKELESVDPKFELFDLAADPFEQQDVASREPDVVASLRAEYDRWFDHVTSTRVDPGPPPIPLGDPRAPVTELTRQDWRRATGERGHAMGYWDVELDRNRRFDVLVHFLPNTRPTEVHLAVADRHWSEPVTGDTHLFEAKSFPTGRVPLEVWVMHEGKRRGAYQLVVQPSVRR